MLSQVKELHYTVAQFSDLSPGMIILSRSSLRFQEDSLRSARRGRAHQRWAYGQQGPQSVAISVVKFLLCMFMNAVFL